MHRETGSNVPPQLPQQMPVPAISAPFAKAVFASTESAPKLISETKKRSQRGHKPARGH